MKIAFHLIGGEDWTVGPIYLRNLFSALRLTYAREPRLCLLAPVARSDAQDYARSIEADEVVLYDVPRRWTALWALNLAAKRLLLYDAFMEGLLRGHGIDVVFSPQLPHQYRRIATLAWLPDFQHIHLPEMFSGADRLSRDRAFQRCAKLATRIMVMSDVVRKDFESFAPRYAHKVRVVHPVSYVPQSIYDYDLTSILNLYHLPEKFVYLPNQFWKHKNHEVAFKAVEILKRRGTTVSVVCTGSPPDYRHPRHFASLFEKLARWNMRDQVIYLGLVPHDHVLVLSRQTICVLNPSLFEGWGYTVDEARSVGKQVLLSDIPAHREQNPPKATFFDPTDCDDLAGKLARIWHEARPGPDAELESEARGNLPGRLNAYAEAFTSVAREAVQEVTS
jgi:glycosyltransferase involved in cell wall biosynthesis